MTLSGAGLNLQTARSQVRTDLKDPSDTYWADTDLNRAIDRAVERYSQVRPNLQISQLATIPYSRIYPYPAGAWWIERVEYPLGRWPKAFQFFKERLSPLIAAPSWTNLPLGQLAPTLAAIAGGSLSTGTYKYAFTYTVPGAGETQTSPQLSVNATAGQAVQISNIPSPPYGATGVNIYRTVAGGAALLLEQSLPLKTPAGTPLTGTGYSVTSTAADASLGAAAPTVNTTDGIQQLEIDIAPERLPADTTGYLELTTAFKHQLDNTGTSIPEKHWDVIGLGAQCYALYAQLTTTNDNFDYVDGQFRDRVDDSKAPAAWRAHALTTWEHYKQRLDQIRNEWETTTPEIAHWGDKPYRYDRL